MKIRVSFEKLHRNNKCKPHNYPHARVYGRVRLPGARESWNRASILEHQQKILARIGQAKISKANLSITTYNTKKNNQIEVENIDCFRDKQHAKNLIISR